MKKLFYPLFGLAALAMTNTSCSDDLENNGAKANEAAVNFTVQLENKVGSRVAGDGTQATKLQYWVYKAEDGAIGTIINGLTGETTVGDDLSAEVSLTLVKGQTYNFLFWAQDPDCTYYTPVPDEGAITVSYTGSANDESRDAFFKVRKDLKVTGPVNETIVLKRPFAQINVGTSVGSLADAKKADVDITKSSFTINNAATRLNAYSGSATETQEVVYTLSEIIESDKTDEVGDLKDVDGKNYEHLAMNYILVADDTDAVTTDKYGVGENKQLVDATFEIFDDKDASINKFDIPNIPVQRNWRTNIIGDILNETVTFNIVIDPNFDKDENGDDHNYFTEKELAYTALNGGEVTLTEDVTLTQTLNVTADMVINMGEGVELNGSLNVADGVSLTVNGGTINNTVDTTSGIVSNGNLTLNGVTVTSARHALRIESGNVVIDGGTYKVEPVSEKTVYALNVGDDNTNANVTIKGGTFIGPKGTIADSGAAIGVKAGSSVTIEDGNFSGGKLNTLSSKGVLTISGGTFDQDPSTYVAEGYVASANTDGTYAVVKGTFVDNMDDLATVLANAAAGSTIVLPENVSSTFTIDELKDVTIEGSKNTVMIFNTTAETKIENVTLKKINFKYTSGGSDCIIINSEAQIDNLVLENCTITGTGEKKGHGLTGFNNNATIEIKNCTFKDMGYPIYAWGGYKALIIENCTFDNIKSWAIMPQSGFDGDLTVTGCNFVNCLGGGLIKAGTLTAGHTFTFTNNTITDCTIAGDHNWFQFNTSAGTTVISGNIKDGVAWTPTATDGLK